MIDILLVVCLLVAFFATFFATKWWIKRANKVGLVGADMNKFEKRNIAEIGGLPVLMGFLFGVLLYVGYRTFISHTAEFNLEILAVTSTITIIAIIGLMDDILGWKLGLQKWQKPLFTLFAALPVMMINIGKSQMILPLIGQVDLGIIYPIIFVPVFIMIFANGFNMLAGYNGLEAGLGIIILGALGYIVWIDQGLGKVAMLAGVMIACLVGFLIFNSFPAAIFPGDTFTYSVGALIAIVAILGNAEKAALFLLIPFVIEFLLKLRGGFKKESFGKPNQDNSLEMPYKKIYGLEHLFIWFLKKVKKRAFEREVVISLYVFELIFVLGVLITL